MSQHGEIRLDFAGEERAFRLTPTKGWRAVQEKTGDGPPAVIKALAMAERPETMPVLQWAMLGGMGSWKVDHIREVIFQGLIGGGLDSGSASKLVIQYVDGEPLLGKVALALQVCLASVIGVEGEETPGEQTGEAKVSPTSA